MDVRMKQRLDVWIAGRLEDSYQRLLITPHYQEIRRRQKKSGEEAEKLLSKLKKHERVTVCKHYEGEIDKTFAELEGAYLQGLRDCMEISAFLGVFGMDGDV
jgi:hypothetical protein